MSFAQSLVRESPFALPRMASPVRDAGNAATNTHLLTYYCITDESFANSLISERAKVLSGGAHNTGNRAHSSASRGGQSIRGFLLPFG